MKMKALLPFILACSPAITFAHNIQLNNSVPNVEVETYGEILVEGKDTTFQAWNSEQMKGKVRIIQAIAGRSAAKAMNADLMAAITAAHFPEQEYQTTTIINQDDAIWGTGSFVKSSAQDSKLEFPWSSIVLDESGNVAKSWDLQPESSTIIVQDKQGNVLFVKEGALNEQEIQQVLELVKVSL
ncbi:YtfJ family protein [Vibrio diazotrophicus]|uniref:YtfJ family protein n=1 Tax=Vibrio diazotrophicus TaxID=685 RepID=UPI000C9E2806|nr:YtfJ family protein [Vibrio diazotrophicus]PNH92777.1 YtfJ family protein [Vibrio diazotrophicus]